MVVNISGSRPVPIGEAAFQRAVLDLAALLRVPAFHSGDPRRDTLAGWPDLALLGRHGLLLRELKTERGRVTSAQRDVLTRLRDAGQDADVWRPTDLASGRIQREIREVA